VEYASFVYPPYNAPLAEAYGGRFESVYIVLHPFVSVPEALCWKATKRYPSDEQIVSQGARCNWAQVAARSGLRTCAKLNQALLTSIRSIVDDLCDFEASSRLESLLEAEPVWMPTEGRFEPMLRMDFLDVFEAAGHEESIFVPEFPHADPIQQLRLATLKTGAQPFPSRGSLVAPDASFLFTVDWDSFFTLFYGPRDFVTETTRRLKLEGFFATPTTEHHWFNYSLGCCVVTLAPDGWAAV
jgi:hypothetical protein